ncbi:EAL domain-containing protein [Marinobacteraceae bacterium S3BR75-40.1]
MTNRTTFHQLINTISANLARIPYEHVDSGIEDALSRLATIIEADRAYIFMGPGNAQNWSNTHSWGKEGAPPLRPDNHAFTRVLYAWLFQRLSQSNCIVIHDTAEMLPEARAQQTLLREQGIQSLLALPLNHGNELLGTITFDRTQTCKPWTLNLCGEFALVSDIIAGTLQRKTTALELEENIARFHKFTRQLPGMLYQYEVTNDNQVRFPFVSERVESLFGLSAQTVREDAQPILDTIHPNDVERVMHSIEVSHEQLSPWRQEFRILGKNGKLHWLEGVSIPEKRPEGVLWHGYLNEVSDRKASQESLKDQAAWTQTILDNIVDAILTIDEGGIIQSTNHSARNTFGYAEGELEGRNISMIMPEPHRSNHDSYIFRYLQSHEARIIGTPRELSGQRKNGSLFPMELQVSETWMHQRRFFIGVIRDITERKQHEEEIERLAYYDVLTGLPNRRLLLDRVQQRMKASARQGLYGALMFLDLDNFKNLNDCAGHHVGDEYLCQVAVRLKEQVRNCDTVARIGGDEFVILLAGLDKESSAAALQAEKVAEKIRLALSRPYQLAHYEFNGTPSIGITLFLDHGTALDEILKQADIAMYQAKAAGKNTLRFFDPDMQLAVEKKLQMENEIRLALREKQFELHYQSQINQIGRITGAEALIRWRHPERGFVSPGQFIPVCEESGLILEVGHWVVETACRQLAKWQREKITRDLVLAINISAKQFHQPDFVDVVLATLEKTGAPARQLELELTESLLVEHVDEVVDKMNSLRTRGVRFSLDDFGTGYSSLAYLKRLPLDQLKIDQSFVRDVLTNCNDQAIARTIIRLADSMSLEVIAEGVEKSEQHQALMKLGCKRFQGYLFARPQPADEFTANLKAHEPADFISPKTSNNSIP